jgi:hypothetical protein
VSDASFQAGRLGELPRTEGELDTIPIRLPFGVRAFGVNAYSGREAGGSVIEEHDELGSGAGGHEELYVVLSGRARFTVDGEEIDGPPGTLVFVRDPAVRRRADATAEDTTVLVVGGTAGKPFEPSPWESWLEAAPFVEARDYEGAVGVLRKALEEHPDNANVLYNLACCEALAGRRTEAVAHLARSADLDPRVRDWARRDPDLGPVRDDPGFPS